MDHTNTSFHDIEFHEEHDNVEQELNENHIQPKSIPPTVGMVFETSNEVKSFYRQYAISKGFGIRQKDFKEEQQERIMLLHDDNSSLYNVMEDSIHNEIREERKHGLQISPSPYVNNNSHTQEEHLHDSEIGHDVDTTIYNVQIQSPKSVKRKGRPRTTRLKSTTERITRKKPSTKASSLTFIGIAETMMEVPNTTFSNNIDVTQNTRYTTPNSIGPVLSSQAIAIF
ncbi:uncharacterized protein HKW66_Vig0040680 [Vigna angularis]|uniref:Protein FAR1-RELATED SEQUENCE n=1 Tax=Phaseolus angularis TaxID=3914 RepID=A0A8T0LB17_PHAAN|nr:uncharacterized protein HKW66_Vig0040680 [Vigna angularis]